MNHAISHVIVHPDYKQGQYHHDIALLVLKTPLNYSGKNWGGAFALTAGWVDGTEIRARGEGEG